jgi:hypothetical protein
MSERDEIVEIRLRPRPADTVELSIPSDALATIREVAATRDMSPEALMRLYIGHGLRQDVSRFFSERVQAEE